MKCTNSLSKSQKARIISLFIIAILLFLNVLLNINSILDSGHEIHYVKDHYVDGEDFSPIANMFIFGANSMIQTATGIFAMIDMIFFSLLFLIPWRLISIRKNSEISKTELDISGKILITFVVITLIVSLIMTHFSYIYYIAFLVLIPTVFFLILSIFPMKNAYKLKNETESSNHASDSHDAGHIHDKRDNH